VISTFASDGPTRSISSSTGRIADDPAEARRHLYRASALFAELSSAHGLEESERELRRVFGPAPEPAPAIARPTSLLGRRHRAPSLVAHSNAMRRVEALARRANVRFISATNADVHGEVAAGRFRQDLLFRLNTVEIHLPPLHERREDIPVLAEHFLRHRTRKYRKTIEGFDRTALDLLQNHSWPGNVRELEHVVERAVLMARGNLIQPGDLGLRAATDHVLRLDDMSLEEVEAHLIKKTLARFDGNAQKATEALGLSHSAFYQRLEKYGL